jgi:hypothetical protein
MSADARLAAILGTVILVAVLAVAGIALWPGPASSEAEHDEWVDCVHRNEPLGLGGVCGPEPG